MILEVAKLDIGYEKVIQENISFTLNAGEILFIRGANGSGKSTLIKTLLEEIPLIKGKINWNDSDLLIKHLPQSPTYDLPLSITLKEILTSFNVEINKISFLPEDFFEKKWIDASGGEKQKSLILTRLSEKLDVLILDEPFNHLDRDGIMDICSFLKKLVEDKIIKSLIIVSHVKADFKNVEIKELILK